VAATGFGHQNNVIDMAVKLKGYSAATGRARYDKGVFFNQTSIPNLTNATCSNVNCHFEKKTPVWNAAAYNVATDCNACHGAPPAGTVAAPAGGLAGSHTRHDVYYTGTANCQKCHPNSTTFSHATSAGRALKVQGFLRDPGNTLEATGTYTGTGLNYLPSKSAAPGFGTCSNIYCHSTAQSATGAGAGTTVTTPAWGGAALTCGSCHVDMSSSAAATGSHIAHVQSSGTVYTCDVCHGTGFGTTTVATATHVNKQINLSFTGTAAGTTYTTKGAAFVPGSAVYSTCATSTCHGAMNPTWGANTAKARCQKCHGYRSSGWNALNGATVTTDTKVGTHFNHISSAGTTKYSAALTCKECHNSSIALATDAVTAAGHIDTAGPAEVAFGTLATKGGTMAPVYTAATLTCATTYCHGGSLASNTSNPPASRVASPVWNTPFLGTASVVGNGSTTPGSGDCSKCHGYPPMTTTHAGKLATDCTGCHSHVNAAGTGFKDATKHINGVVDGGGVSSGGSTCYGCHSTFQATMDATGASRTASYHHVLGGALGTGDIAPNTGSYPTSTTDVYCTSCHTDHNYFNSAKASNLRSDIAVTSGAAPVNTDFLATGSFGICVSCHKAGIARDTTNQKAGGVATTPVIDGALFAASMHNYTTMSSFGSQQFAANCVKCHTDEQAKDKQTSTNKFGPHFSASVSVLDDLGTGTNAQYREQTICFRCHSQNTDTALGGTLKTVNGKDWFGSNTMRSFAEDTFKSFTAAGRSPRHKISAYNGKHQVNEALADIALNKHVECADCHSPHAAKFGNHSSSFAAPFTAVARGTRGTKIANVLAGATGVTVTTWGAASPTTKWGLNANTYGQTGTTALPVATMEYQLCFKCHTNAMGATGWFKNMTSATPMGGKNLTWTDLSVEFNPNNASRHPVGTALATASQLTAAKLKGGWTPGSIMTCSDCHNTDSTASKGPHGSAVKWMLAGTNKAWPYTLASQNGGTTGTLFRIATYSTGNGTKDGLFCLNCHTVTASNNWHSNTNVSAGQHGGNAIMACASCHIRVPHGGKISRLLQTTGAPARYRSNASTATSSWDFWGTSTVNIKGSAFASGNFNSSCGQHNSGGSGGEAW
jgi:predicted CxxxxCH...CXXCH cytochrome family protein